MEEKGRKWSIRGLMVFAGLILLFPSSVRADWPVVPLGELIQDSESIVIGVVSEVSEADGSGIQLAGIDVEEVLLGSDPSPLTLRGSTTDPSLPEFSTGVRILIFLQQSPGSNSVTNLEPVGGDRGVMPVADGALAPTLNIVTKAIASGEKLKLSDVQESLKTSLSGQPSPGLVASLNEELTLRVTAEEAPLVEEFVCSEGLYLPAAQLWAISRVSFLQVSGAKPCLEEFITDFLQQGENRTLALASTEALGDFGDPASLPVLIQLLPKRPFEPGMKRLDKSGDTNVDTGFQEDDGDGDTEPDGNEEPEDEILLHTNASDTVEFQAGENLSTAEDPASDGNANIDGQSVFPKTKGHISKRFPKMEDAFSRRSDGGLSEAAVLALGKIGDPAATPVLFRIAREGDDLALHSTAVHALGLIGTRGVQGPLIWISKAHPNELIRDQAQRTLDRIRKERSILKEKEVRR